MEINTVIIIAAQATIALILGFVIKTFLPNYFSKKGENLATKEDIEEITEKIESVRVEFAQRQHRGQAAFDKEFQVFVSLQGSVKKLQQNTIKLRPWIGTTTPNETKEEKLEKLKKFLDAYESFNLLIVNNQPFFSKEIYKELNKIKEICFQEKVTYEYVELDGAEPAILSDYWEQANKNTTELRTRIATIEDLIRKRIS